MDRFEQVTVVKKANVYYEGKVTSRTVLFADWNEKDARHHSARANTPSVRRKKSTWRFSAACSKRCFPGESAWQSFSEGQSFEVPAQQPL